MSWIGQSFGKLDFGYLMKNVHNIYTVFIKLITIGPVVSELEAFKEILKFYSNDFPIQVLSYL